MKLSSVFLCVVSYFVAVKGNAGKTKDKAKEKAKDKAKK